MWCFLREFALFCKVRGAKIAISFVGGPELGSKRCILAKKNPMSAAYV